MKIDIFQHKDNWQDVKVPDGRRIPVRSYIRYHPNIQIQEENHV